MIDDPEKRKGSGIDGLLAAYVMLDKDAGWDYLNKILKNDGEEFLMRYAGLRTLRFFWDQRPDLVAKKSLVESMSQLLSQPDMADFAVEDLRKWKQWDMTGKILDLYGKKDYEATVIRRAILRFALQSPEARAAQFVRDQRQRDSDWVKDTEELLKLEN